MQIAIRIITHFNLTYSTRCDGFTTSLSLSNDISLVNFANILRCSLLICFYLLAKRLSLVLLILNCVVPYLVAHTQIAKDLLFGLWCHMDILVFQLCMYICVCVCMYVCMYLCVYVCMCVYDCLVTFKF